MTADGYLDATVSTASETYYVEPASRYFGANRSADSFPAVIYKSSDVAHPDRDHHHESCSSHQFYLKHFEESRRISQHCANNRPEIANAARCNQSSPAVIQQHNHHHHQQHDNDAGWLTPFSFAPRRIHLNQTFTRSTRAGSVD